MAQAEIEAAQRQVLQERWNVIIGESSPDHSSVPSIASCVLPINNNVLDNYPERLSCNLQLQDEELEAVSKVLYQMTSLRQDPESQENHVRINFLSNVNQAHIATLKNSSQSFSALKADVNWLFRILTVSSGLRSIRTKRALVLRIINTMTKQDLNDHLMNEFRQEGDDINELTLIYTVFFQRFIVQASELLQVLYVKVWNSLRFYYHSKHIQLDMQCLDTAYLRMLQSLSDRQLVNTLATHILNLQDECAQLLTLMVTYGNQQTVHKINYLIDVRVHDSFSHQNLSNWVEQNQILHNVIHMAAISPPTLPPFVEWRTSLEKVLRELRNFVPTPSETAQYRLNSQKQKIINLSKEIGDFLDDEERPVGKAERLLSDLKLKKSTLENFEAQGASVTDETCGTSLNDLNDYHNKLVIIIRDARLEEKKQELELSRTINQSSKNIPTLKLIELHSVNNWLEWKRSWAEVIQNYYGDFNKKAVVLASLKDKIDYNACRSLTYSEMISFLEAKYDDSNLVISIVEDLLKMSPAHTDNQCHNNLSRFKNSYQLLLHHNCLERIDKNFRQRITPILLSRDHYLEFQRKVHAFEEGLKKENNVVDELSDAGTNIVQELESKRRENWLDLIEDTYLFIRKLIVATSKSAGKKGFNSNNSNFKIDNRSMPKQPDGSTSQNFAINNQQCPVCNNIKHAKNDSYNNLAKCIKFKQSDYETKKSYLKQFFYCYRCLRPRATNHPEGICKLQQEQRGTQFQLICNLCSPPSERHHRLLHPPSTQGGVVTQDKPSYNGSGGNGGGGGGGGSGNSNFGRFKKKKKFNKRTSFQTSANGGGGSHAEQDLPCNNVSSLKISLRPSHPDSDNQLSILQHYKQSGVSNEKQGEPCEIKAKYKKFISNLPANTLFTLLACSTIKLIVNNLELDTIALLDCGSSSSYISKSVVKQLNPKYVCSWSGVLGTLTGQQNEVRNIFSLGVKCVNSIVQNVRLLETESGSLGFKTKIPNPLFEALCLQYTVPVKSVQNVDGPIEILLGLDMVNLLLQKVHTAKQSNKIATNVILCSTPLSAQYVFVGNLWSGITSEHEHNTRSYLIKNDLLRNKDNILNRSLATIYSLSSQQFGSKSLSELDSSVCKTHNKCKMRFIPGFDFMNEKVKKKLIVALIYFPFINMIQEPKQSQQILTHLILPWTHHQCSNIVNKVENKLINIVDVNKINQSKCYLKKNNPIIDSFFDSGLSLGVQCSDCILKSRHCLSCRYLSSSISLIDINNLSVYRDHMSVGRNDDGDYLMFDFPYKTGMLTYFEPQYSNKQMVFNYTLKLKTKLEKRKLLEAFHNQIRKAINEGHIEVFTKPTCNLNPQNWIQQNYVEKISVSTPVRITSNTTTKNRSGYCTNDAILPAPAAINSGASVLCSWRMYAIGYSTDISQFYRQVRTTEQSNNVRLFFWYDCENFQDIEKLKLVPSPHRYIRLTFGDVAASPATEIAIRNFVAPKCKDVNAAEVLSEHRLVDDVLSSETTHAKVNTILEDITFALSCYGFRTKYVVKTGEKTSSMTPVLGVDWDSETDLVYVNTILNPSPKVRGIYKNEALTKYNVRNLSQSREVYSRFCGQAFSYNGLPLAPLQAGLRIMFSSICEQIDDWRTSLSFVNPHLDAQFKKVLMNLTNLKDSIEPYNRCILPEGFKLKSINVCGDSGNRCYAMTCHAVSFNVSSNKWHSALITCRPKLHSLTLPIGEASSMVYAIKVLTEVLTWSSFSKLLTSIDYMVDITFQSDSSIFCHNLNPSTVLTEIQQRNTVHNFYRLAAEITAKFKNVTISVLHTRSDNMPADKASKLFVNIPKQCNSKVFRFGNPETMKSDWPIKSRIFLMFRHGINPIFKSVILDNQPSNVTKHKEEDEEIKINQKTKKKSGSEIKNSFISCLAVLTRARAKAKTTNITLCKTDENPKQSLQLSSELKEDNIGQNHEDKVVSETFHDDSVNYDHSKDSSLTKEVSNYDTPTTEKPIVKSPNSVVKKESEFLRNLSNLKLPTISYELYQKLFENNSTLFKLINVLIIILSWFYKTLASAPYEFQKSFAFLALVKTHQELYKLPKKYKSPLEKDSDGILRAINRLGEDECDILNLNYMPPIVNSSDKKFVNLLIAAAHETKNPKFNPIHVGINATLLALRQGNFGSHITRDRDSVKKYIKHCHTCIVVAQKSVRIQLGGPRWARYVTQKKLIFNCISMDSIGPMLCFMNNKKHTFYLNIVSCLLTRSTNIIYLEDLKYETVMLSLRQHVCQYGIFERIYTDCGSSIYPKIHSKTWIKLFGSTFRPQVIRIGKGMQALNFSESISVKYVRKLFRSSFIYQDNMKTQRNLSIQELLLVVEMFKNICNSRPLFWAENYEYILTPNHFLNNYQLNVSNWDQDWSQNLSFHNNSLQIIFEKLQVNQQLFIKFLKELITINYNNKKLTNPQSCFIFKDLDIVLIQRSKLYLGIIKNSKGQYSEVLSAEVQPPKIFSVHNSKLILLFRSKNEKDELNLRGCVQNSEISTDKRKGFCALIRQKPLQKPFFLSQLGGVCQNVTLQGPPR